MNVERIQQEQLNEIANMPRGWDSYDAVPINKRAILEARRIVSFMPGYWTIVPRADGALQLERHAGGLDIECVISGESPTQETAVVLGMDLAKPGSDSTVLWCPNCKQIVPPDAQTHECPTANR